MSSIAVPTPSASHRVLWRSQAAQSSAVELRKNFITKRGFWIYLLALAPAAVIWLHSFVTLRRPDAVGHTFSKDTEILAGIFQIFFLASGGLLRLRRASSRIYFAAKLWSAPCTTYFLSPVRREVLVAGKYLAGLITAAFFFCGSIALCFAGMYAHFPGHEIRAYLVDGPGLGHLLAYVGNHGAGVHGIRRAIFWLGIRYKNPIIPAVILLFWESVNIFLPSWLKK